jgi:hypothetical protein
MTPLTDPSGSTIAHPQANPSTKQGFELSETVVEAATVVDDATVVADATVEDVTGMVVVVPSSVASAVPLRRVATTKTTPAAIRRPRIPRLYP